MKHRRELRYVSKNERNLCVDNISLCDERKSRKIGENKLHLGSFREPWNPWTRRNYTFETKTWPVCGETIPLKLKFELCETSKFMHIIICTSDTIFLVDHSRGSSYNLMYWRSLNGKIRLTSEENVLFQVFNIPS